MTAAAAIALAGCNRLEMPSGHEDYYETGCYLRDRYMSIYYYWADEVAGQLDKLDIDGCGSLENAFDAMLYSPTDRWSWMMDAPTYFSYESGEITGSWGISLTQPVEDFKDYKVYVALIYEGSPLASHGVTRGAQLTGIKGLDFSDGFQSQEDIEYFNEHFYDSPQEFSFILADGSPVTFTEKMSSYVNTNYIHAARVFTSDDFPGLAEPVGYFNYSSFMEAFVTDMDEAFAYFKGEGVKKMIVDLRYNGGGSSSASQRLISYLAPAGSQGKVYEKRKHNALLSENGFDSYQYFGKKNSDDSYSDISIGLDEVYFIMTGESASASEVVYNGLRPYLGNKVHLVGRQTYGKPNGMYVLYYPGESADYDKYNAGNYSGAEWVFLPICFYNVNSEDESIPATGSECSGFVPDNDRPDDIYHDFGVEEGCINACLTHIATGRYPAATASTKSAGAQGFITELAVPQSRKNPNYGSFVAPLPR